MVAAGFMDVDHRLCKKEAEKMSRAGVSKERLKQDKWEAETGPRGVGVAGLMGGAAEREGRGGMGERFWRLNLLTNWV